MARYNFWNEDLLSDGQWHDYEHIFSEIRGNRRIIFYLKGAGGEGFYLL